MFESIFKKKINPNALIPVSILISFVIGLARKIEVSPREFLEFAHDTEANNKYMETLNELMKDKLKK